MIIADTFGRPWREGLVNIAIGVAGFAPLKSYLGDRDPAGRPLQATILAIADELAGAAEPVMGKLDRIPAAHGARPAAGGERRGLQGAAARSRPRSLPIGDERP